mmetsp:Transcript_23209/g.92607  ORF Transcript_23209/g.92607 Transcript_23209/m.92607 type:complete len:97 (+) Transcript_23209:358-648(+)
MLRVQRLTGRRERISSFRRKKLRVGRWRKQKKEGLRRMANKLAFGPPVDIAHEARNAIEEERFRLIKSVGPEPELLLSKVVSFDVSKDDSGNVRDI